MRRLFLVVVWSVASAVRAIAQPATPAGAVPAPPAAPDETAAFFASRPVLNLTIQIAPDDAARLKADARQYVPFILLEDGKEVASGGGVKLKGAAGSFREFDDRPAFTLNLDKFGGTSKLHGLTKLHLNNSVQDESLLCEWVCSEVFRAAGYPATRVAHARVRVNDRDLGFYVLKEGFDRPFLARSFPKAAGNFYDSGFCQDIDAELELDLSGGEKDRADLKRLAAACGEEDAAKRRTLLAEALDVEKFTTFAALELLVGHWDGYCQSVNNYRVFFGPDRRARFLPHGMDQCFQDPDMHVLDPPNGRVAQAAIGSGPGRAAYRRELERLLPLVESPDLAARAKALQSRINAAIRAVNPEAADAQADRARELLERLAARGRAVRAQLAEPEETAIEFPEGVAVEVPHLTPRIETEDAAVERVEEAGQAWYRVAVGESGRCIAGWRRRLPLPKGSYRLEALARVKGVKDLDEDGPGRGAGLRISGADRKAEGGSLSGDGERAMAFAFEVKEGNAEVELVLELRAAAGEARFRADSVRLTRLAPTP